MTICISQTTKRTTAVKILDCGYAVRTLLRERTRDVQIPYKSMNSPPPANNYGFLVTSNNKYIYINIYSIYLYI